MDIFGKHGENANLEESIGLSGVGSQFWNLSPAELIEDTIINGHGMLTDTGAIAIETGEFTGRSPKDRFVVCDEKTEDAVWWGDINIPFDLKNLSFPEKIIEANLNDKDFYVRDSYACADEDHRLNLRVVTELPWSNHVCLQHVPTSY